MRSITKQINILLLIVLTFCTITTFTYTAYAEDSSGETEVYYDAVLKTSSLGNYEVTVKAYERPSHEVLPIISSDYFPTSESKYKTEIDNTAPSATYKANTVTKVDVVFALGELSQKEQFTNYTKTFKSILDASGNYLDSRVEAVETKKSELSGQGYNVDDIINNWDVIGADIWQSTNGQIFCRPNNSWSGTAMLSPDGYESTETTYKIKVESTGQLLDGICFNVTRNGNRVSGYFINFGGHGSASCNLYRFDNYDIGTSFSSGANSKLWCWGNGWMAWAGGA